MPACRMDGCSIPSQGSVSYIGYARPHMAGGELTGSLVRAEEDAAEEAISNLAVAHGLNREYMIKFKDTIEAFEKELLRR